eukprot:scaffold25231_cov201-Cylindrotheca_fusiformis.AAC.2
MSERPSGIYFYDFNCSISMGERGDDRFLDHFLRNSGILLWVHFIGRPERRDPKPGTMKSII